MGNVTQVALKSSAPGQYLGFTLQTVRLAFHLLTAPAGSKVSVEFDDDVGIIQPGGNIVLEQTKSALSQNPISDWAEDLWKAFANWSEVIAQRGYDPNSTVFRLYVTPPKTGKFAVEMTQLSKEGEIKKFLATLKAKLANKNSPPACAAYLKKFFDAPEIVQVAIIRNFIFQSDQDDPVEPIRQLLNAILPNHAVEAMADFVLGAAQKLADKKIRGGDPALVDVDPFRARFHAFVQKHDLSKLLISVSGPPGEHEIKAVLAQAPRFVQQLELVEMPVEDCMRAVSAFLQTSADKTAWAENGLVVPDSFDQFDADLLSRYHFIRTEIGDVHQSISPQGRGRVLYARCCTSAVKLEAREVPVHFICGCFNALADHVRVGWHPDYEKLLNQFGVA